ncbi:hypothetical protein BGZ70_000479 [Mortierella alpina]|uniref:E2F-associated phosphoprotein n=1 Tax=Mortierella alpina TaxID=64518 RepID=A0A9P6IXP9_MORAP|nr:hypothetical protein BGZ70_000479 [Mortierella alpina]
MSTKSTAAEPKVRFSAEDVDSESDLSDIDNSAQVKAGTPDYYDPVYFDTDEDTDEGADEGEDQDQDEMDYDASAGLSGQTGKVVETNITEITEGLEQSSIRSSSGSKKTKKHPALSNAELLYDPDEDDRDENWLLKKIAANRPPGCSPEDIWTDAVLSCPMCLTQLCFDCQQHEVYPHQFRAMFVEHCRVIENERLRFPKETKKTTKSKDTTSEAATSSQEFKPSEDDEADAVYHPVVCEICNTKVALIDQDEVYHFFNVIPTSV